MNKKKRKAGRRSVALYWPIAAALIIVWRELAFKRPFVSGRL